jgi:transposase
VYYRRVAFCYAFLWAKGLNAKDIQKEIFSVCGRKRLSRNVVHNWVEKFSEGRLKVADDARPGAEVAEATVKIFLCCGFRRTGKAMGASVSVLVEDTSRNT